MDLQLSDAARTLHEKAIVVDLHAHPLMNMRYFGKDPTRRRSPPLLWNPLRNHIDIPRALEGGVTAIGSVAYAAPNPFRRREHFRSVKKDIDCLNRVTIDCSDRVVRVRNASDIRRAKAEQKLGLFLAVEGAHALDGTLDHLGPLKEEGLVYLTLTHFLCNDFANSSSDPNPPFPGLSHLGRELVAELNRLNILIDVAHLSEDGFWEVIRLSKKPVIATHTGLRSFCDHPRNLSDDQLRAIVDSGGMVGITFFPWFLHKHGIFGAVDWIVESILHSIEVAGPKSVGIGSDMDGAIWLPKDFRDVRAMPLLTEGLLRAGLSEQDILGVLGGNILELMERAL